MSSYFPVGRVISCILIVILCQLANPVSPDPQTHHHRNEESSEMLSEDGDDRNAFEGFAERSSMAGRRTPPAANVLRTSNGGDGSTIMFPTSPRLNVSLELASPSTRVMEPRRPGRGKAPLKFLRRLAAERDLSKIFENFVTNVKLQDTDGQKYLVDLRGRPIEVGLEERVGISSRVSKPAICEPELKTVEIPAANDPSIIQFPRCVHLERCGGCCGSDLLTCEPTRSKQTEVQVQKFAYNDETEKLEYRETQIMILPSHMACQCKCRVKAADCSPRHVYSNEDCVCNCRNRGEQELCHQKDHKLWDATLCQCVCREIKVCSSGYMFNIDSCECVVNSERDRKGIDSSSVRDEEQNPRRNRREHVGLRLMRQ